MNWKEITFENYDLILVLFENEQDFLTFLNTNYKDAFEKNYIMSISELLFNERNMGTIYKDHMKFEDLLKNFNFIFNSLVMDDEYIEYYKNIMLIL